MAAADEMRWMDRARQGDRQAFAKLVHAHQGAVRALLRRLTGGQWALTDDLAQETFLRAWQSLPRFRSEARFGTWVYRIAYNTYLMHVRSAKSTVPAGGVDTGDAGDESIASTGTDLVAQGEVQRMLMRLSPPERAAIIQCYYLGLNHEEAATVLNCPLGTVKSHLRRALAKLRDHLSEPVNESESDEPAEQHVRA